MKNSVSFEQIVARLAEVLNNPVLSAEYNKEGEMYEGICGWCGVMAPLTRPAYLKEFGEETVLNAEREARKVIQEKAEAYERSQFHAHELEANKHKAEGAPTPVREGQFVWAVSSCMKGDGGYQDEIKSLVKFNEDGELSAPRLCCIEKVIHVDELPMSCEDCDRLVADYALKGGCCSDDLAEDVDMFRLSKDELATLYTMAAAVVDKSGRWYLADAEGYDYVRYYYSPLDWATMFATEVGECRRKMEERKAEEERKAAQEAADRLADYYARCQKWEDIMQPIKSFEDARTACYRAYSESGFSRRSPEAKALRSAETKLNNARKRNVLAMVQAAFPGVKFSLRKYDGWGADWQLSWEDGPTEEQFNEVTDLDLFSTYHDAFDGMQDMAYTVKMEHTDFARKYMGDRSNAIETKREMSEAKRAELLEAIFAAVPAADEGKDDYGHHNTHDYTDEEASTLADTFGLKVGDLFPQWDFSHTYPTEIAHRVYVRTGYYTAPETPTPDPTPTRDKKSRQSEENGANDGESAPAPGLRLVELSEGCVAVVGADWKDTYFHKREIKAHGCTWNKEAQQWQATDSEAVAAVRAWFGQAETLEDTTDTGEVAPSPTPSDCPDEQENTQEAPCYSASAKSQKWEEEDKAVAEKYGYTLEMARSNYGENYTKFHKIKKSNPSALLLFRMGDYYELYGQDAGRASRVLHMPTISPHDLSGENDENQAYLFHLLPIPASQIGDCLRNLVSAGYRCATAEPENDNS